MWTDKLGRATRGTDPAREIAQVRQIQQTLWYVLTVIAVAEMMFGAWAVGLIFR